MFNYRERDFRIMGVSTKDYIYRKIREYSGFYELDLLLYIESCFPHGVEVCIDVGANIGNHSVYFGNFICKDLIAIEVNPMVTPVLRKNLSMNLDSFTLYETAVGMKKSRGRLKNPVNVMSALGMVSVVAESGGDVEISTLDALYSTWCEQKETPNKHISFVKLDIEGMELDALKGASQLLAKDHPDLFIEAANATAYRALVDYLSQFQYSAINSHAITPVYHFKYRASAWASLTHATLHKLGFYYFRSRSFSFISRMRRR